LPRQHAGTIRKKWAALGSLFEQATAEQHLIRNPFVAEALLIKAKVPANRRRDLFEPSDLATLLASDLPGHLYWLTWLSLYAGARLNELCQLTTAHVRQYQSIWFLYFSPELRLKTGDQESCIRSVPIHSKRIELGFLDYVKRCNGQLFPGLPQHRSGRFSDAPSKAFSRHLKVLGIKRPKLSFHSLRKTFGDKLRSAAPADFENRERLLGHASNGVAAHYHGSYEAEADDTDLLVHRAKLIERLQF